MSRVSGLGNNPTTFLHLMSTDIRGGPGYITITEEEAHYDEEQFTNYVKNENKHEINMKNNIDGVIKVFNIKNDTVIHGLKYRYEESSNFQKQMFSRMKKRTFAGNLERGQYYATYAEMQLFVVQVTNEDGMDRMERFIAPTGKTFSEPVTEDDFENFILDESWETLLRKWNAPLKCYKQDELMKNIQRKGTDIPRVGVSIPKMIDNKANVVSEGSHNNDIDTALSGIKITNDLDQGDLTNIKIYSVISQKGANNLSYVFNWSYVDVEKDSLNGLWQSRQIVSSPCKIPPGDQTTLECSLRFDETFRHYWQFKCEIGEQKYKISKNNAQANLWDMDDHKIPRFIILKEGEYFRINMMFPSGTAYFYLTEY